MIVSIVNDAKSTQQKTGQILQANLMGLNTGAQVALPDANLLARQVRRHREENVPTDLNVPTRAQIVIPTRTKTPSLQRHNASYYWYMDATFKTTPKQYMLMYSIHGRFYGEIIPLIYTLLPGKDERLYTRKLEQLRLQHGIAAPQSVTTNFEKAPQNALERVFPDLSPLSHRVQWLYLQVTTAYVAVPHLRRHEAATDVVIDPKTNESPDLCETIRSLEVASRRTPESHPIEKHGAVKRRFVADSESPNVQRPGGFSRRPSTHIVVEAGSGRCRGRLAEKEPAIPRVAIARRSTVGKRRLDRHLGSVGCLRQIPPPRREDAKERSRQKATPCARDLRLETVCPASGCAPGLRLTEGLETPFHPLGFHRWCR
ncbi:unnamed protein product [Darwinula stevensoni]|uniref:MULE transposase domain-containing protein n=1 Tax=Darwinula stevensoni TaxID=69355 RepID=A0A7R8X0F2_9CRUS|nr:unnamed protein product [Darwinula stevensoni]CAG0881615.1 unnamed protein product [Darwinula stevensoni]